MKIQSDFKNGRLTLQLDGELFWGADSFPMMLDYLADPGLFETPEMQRIAALPIGAARAL